MPTDTPAASSAPWQARPVFISSTFADMQAERTYLATHVFPRLEEKLRERRHQFEPIDLRMGVETVSLPDEQARELQVLKVCLEEIERSRPFLIVLLGDRYGWVPAPDRMQAAVQERGFSTDLQGKSITALEIEFGLMKKDAQQRQRSFIYLRDALPYTQMPPELAAAYSDAHATDSGAPDRVQQLQALKTNLQADADLQSRIHPYHADWDGKAQHATGLEAWGEQVFQHLWAELDEETRAHASAAPQTWQQQERAALQEFVDQRRRDFIGREKQLKELIDIVRSPATSEGQQPTTPWGACVTGGSGAGKSALMAELCARLGSEPGLLVLANAAGATAQGADPDAMLRRFIDELAGALGTRNPLPDNPKPDEVESTFASLLGQASQRQRVVLLLDALNQFDATPRGQQLTWLRARQWPANARLIATALPEAPGAAVLGQAQGVVTVPLPALAESDIAELSSRVWARYHREINAEVVQALKGKKFAGGQAAGNPLWLTLALEQLNLLDADDFQRAQKDFPGNTAAEKLHALLLDTVKQMPPDVPGLYGALLEYTEKAYGQAHARAFAVLIALGRFGWRETDLLPLVPAVARLLFPDQQVLPLDDLGLAVLRRGFRAHLVRRGAAGQLDFFHVQMRAAVQRRALGDAALVKRCHSAIADHLEGLPVGDPLRDAELMVHLIGADAPLRAATLYADLPAESSGLMGATQALFRHLTLGTAEQSEVALAWVAALPGQAGLGNVQLASVCHRFVFELSDALAASSALRTRERVARSAHDGLCRLTLLDPSNLSWKRDLSAANLKVGDVLVQHGNLSGAFEAFKAGREISKMLVDANPTNALWQRDLAGSNERIGNVFSALGNLAEALHYFHAGREGFERLAPSDRKAAQSQRNLGVSYNEIGNVLSAQGALAEALRAFRAAQTIFDRMARQFSGEVSWRRDIAVSADNAGDVLVAQGKFDEALRLFLTSHQIFEDLVHKEPNNAQWRLDLSRSHERLGALQSTKGNSDGALRTFRASIEIRDLVAKLDPQNTEWQRDLSLSHDRIGDMQQAQGDATEALKSFRAGLAIAKRLALRGKDNVEWQRDLSVSHNKVGDVLFGQGDYSEATQRYRDALEIRKRLTSLDPTNTDWRRDLAVSYTKIGDVLSKQGERSLALEAFQAGHESFSWLGQCDKENLYWQRDLSLSHDRLGDVLSAQGKLTEAIRAYQNGMVIHERLALDRTNALWQRDLAVSHFTLHGVLSVADNERQAQEHLLECFKVLNSMHLAGMNLDPPMRGLLKKLEASGVMGATTMPARPVSSALTQPAPARIQTVPLGAPVTTPPENSLAHRAARLNIEYQEALARWNGLTWWQQLRATKPEPPQGI